MAWIASYETVDIKPLSFKDAFQREAQLRDYLWQVRHWPHYFGFRPWAMEFHIERGSSCKVDFVGTDKNWLHGYIVELKLGNIREVHLEQARRYVRAFRKYKSWGKSVIWHPLVVALYRGELRGAWA